VVIVEPLRGCPTTTIGAWRQVMERNSRLFWNTGYKDAYLAGRSNTRQFFPLGQALFIGGAV
jgi:hypothetical protein